VIAITDALAEDRFVGEHLGRQVYRLTQPARAADVLPQLVAAARPLLVEAKVPVADVATLGQLTALGFRVIDTGIQLDVPAATLRGVAPSSLPVRDATAADREAVERVTGDNLITSRFHLDPAIEPQRATALKRAWAANYFDGRRGQRLLVVDGPSAVAGFVLALERGAEGVIDLVALDPSLRGTGALGALLRAWMERAPAVTRVVVGTQASNVRSLRAYGRLGFRVCAATYVLHYHA
jgi:RimJ/RimL family protein N-acetyltransferase